MAAEGLPIEVTCQVPGVSVSGYYEWLNHPLSARALRHIWLMERIASFTTGLAGHTECDECMPS